MAEKARPFGLEPTRVSDSGRAGWTMAEDILLEDLILAAGNVKIWVEPPRRGDDRWEVNACGGLATGKGSTRYEALRECVQHAKRGIAEGAYPKISER